LKTNQRIEMRQDSGHEGYEGGERSDEPGHGKHPLEGLSKWILGA
jgi:hypothetical protein